MSRGRQSRSWRIGRSKEEGMERMGVCVRGKAGEEEGDGRVWVRRG